MVLGKIINNNKCNNVIGFMTKDIYVFECGNWKISCVVRIFIGFRSKFTETRYLPAVMKEAGIVLSTNEVRKNKPQYNVTLENQTV